MATAKKPAPSNPEKVALSDFHFAYNGQLLEFKAGKTFTPDSALLKALSEASAPFADAPLKD